MEIKNMSGAPSCNNYLPSQASRPKVVLVNPNFQRKQALSRKTIYVNPLFKSSSTGDGQQVCFSHLTACASGNSSKDQHAPIKATLSTLPVSFFAPREDKWKPVSHPDFLSKNHFFKNDSTSKPTEGISYPVEPPQPECEEDYTTLSWDKATTSQQCMKPHLSQSHKTYVNPKFLKTRSKTQPEMRRKASVFYINAAVLNPAEVAAQIKNHSKLSLSDSKDTTNLLPPVVSAVEAAKQIVSDPIAVSSPSEGSETRTKATISGSTVEGSDSTLVPSTSSMRSAQKKTINLLRLRKITKLSQLARISQLRNKNIKVPAFTEHNHANPFKKFVQSTKFSFKRVSSKRIISIQKPISSENHFSNGCDLSNNPNNRKNMNTRVINKTSQCNPLHERDSPFKKCSKFKIVRHEVQKYRLSHRHVLNRCQPVPVSILKLTNGMISNGSRSSSNAPQPNPQKLTKVSNVEPHQSISRTLGNEITVGTSNSNATKTIAIDEPLFVSKRKLIRKPPVRRMSYSKTRSSLSINKFVPMNVNLPHNRSYAPSYKIHFKPSRTSSDVIYKRMIQRQVINHYKLLNVQQNQSKTHKWRAPLAAPDKLKQKRAKQVLRGKERRISVSKTASSSFVSIGKTKLIRRSAFTRRHHNSSSAFSNSKLTVNNFKPSITSTPNYRKLNSQLFSWKATDNRKTAKPMGSDLVAIGKTKLIKQSLLHWRRHSSKSRSSLTNVAAASVIQKQLRKFCRALPGNDGNKKLLRRVHSSKFKLKNLPTTAGRRILAKRRIALRCKNNIPCETFHKYGRCKKVHLGKCFKLHDRKYIAVCQAFVQGACKAHRCLLSHDVIPQKMPTCLHFLQGACSRSNCLYPHVKLSAKAPICRDFVRGFCALGLDCDKLHVLLCPELEKNGVCTSRTTCKFAHRKKVICTKMTAAEIKGKKSSTSLVTAQHLKNKTFKTEQLEINNEPSKRYFSTTSENDLKSFIPRRPQLGSLPSFIPLSTCDSLENN